MSQADKIKDKSRQAVGYLKFKLGQATGNRTMQTEGGKDMAAGKSREVGHDAKDAIKRDLRRTNPPKDTEADKKKDPGQK